MRRSFEMTPLAGQRLLWAALCGMAATVLVPLGVVWLNSLSVMPDHSAGLIIRNTVLEGTGRFTIDGKPHVLTEGQSIVMPVNIPHAVYGEERFKMLLTVVF